MAINNRVYPKQRLIHHSDRGSQYCSRPYVEVLIKNNIAISITENGAPYENAITERVNGILKEEFGLHSSGDGYRETAERIGQHILTYNQSRPHASCDYLPATGALPLRTAQKTVEKQVLSRKTK